MIEESSSRINFGVIHDDMINYLEIYVRVFLNYVSKDVLKLVSDCVNLHCSYQIDFTDFQHKLISKASYHSQNLVRYVDLSICDEAISDIYNNFTENDYSSFLRIVNK